MLPGERAKPIPTTFRTGPLRLAIPVLMLAATAASNSAAQTPKPSIASTCVPAAISSLNVVLRAQKTEQWCWAASAQMLMEYLGKTVEQCDQANVRLGRSDCCKSPTPTACIAGGGGRSCRAMGLISKKQMMQRSLGVTCKLSWPRVTLTIRAALLHSPSVGIGLE